MARRGNQSALGLVVLGFVALGLIILVFKWLLITAAILVLPFTAWWVYDKTQGSPARRRRIIEARATVDAGGGCGWCGSRVKHEDYSTGRVLLPAEFHREEIERTIQNSRVV